MDMSIQESPTECGERLGADSRRIKSIFDFLITTWYLAVDDLITSFKPSILRLGLKLTSHNIFF